MKSSFALLGMAVALALPTLGSATTMNTMSWNFLNNVPKGSSGVSVGSSKSFTDVQHDATTILASVDPKVSGFTLYEKNEGFGEMGLGITQEADREINAHQPGVLLNLANLVALDPSAVFLTFNSITDGEQATITYIDGDHDGDTFTTAAISDNKPVSLDLNRLKEDRGSILVQATNGDVLIAGVTATPEPAAAGLVGLGLLAAGMLGRKRVAKQA